MTLSRPRDRIPVLLLEGIHDGAVEHFRRAGYTNVQRLPATLPRDELRRRLPEVSIIGIRSRTHLDAELLSTGRPLLAIGCFCIGTNQVDLRAAAERGIPVFNAPHSNTRSVAELVMGEAVMLFRGIPQKNAAAHDGRWLKSAKGAHELRGKTLGIVGYGHIGAQVSILAEAFGMRVLFHDIVPKLPLGNARALSSLDDLLGASDLVSLHVPQTPVTKGLIGAQQLDRMRRGAFLINASRGTVVDIDALAERLRDGRLGGAAVDVYPAEPASHGDEFVSPLRGLPNALLTPHIGGSTEEAQANIGLDVAAKLVEYSDLGTTTGAVNFPALGLTPHAGAHRVLHIHQNRPGVLGEINRVIAGHGANILGQHLQTVGDVGYVVIDVEAGDAEPILEPLRAVAGTLRTRVLY